MKSISAEDISAKALAGGQAGAGMVGEGLLEEQQWKKLLECDVMGEREDTDNKGEGFALVLAEVCGHSSHFLFLPLRCPVESRDVITGVEERYFCAIKPHELLDMVE